MRNQKEHTPDTPEKMSHQAEVFANRLTKQYRHLRKWARNNRISCYRLYDRDIPEVPLACDLYTFLPDDIGDKLSAILFLNEQNASISRNDQSSSATLAGIQSRTYLHMYLYERPYDKPEDEEKKWLDAMAEKASTVLGIERDHVIIKTRRRQSGTEESRTSQYEKIHSEKKVTGIVFEQGQIFHVNLSDYIDTGLFFDHRPLREMVRSSCAGKSVLNLFCYTSSFSVYAAEGRAKKVDSVDLSRTYIEWGQKNMALNDFTDQERYTFTRDDVSTFLDKKIASKADFYDIIILDPPTFSNSKKTESTLDLNRDWSALVTKCLSLLSEKGVLYFSTNSRRLSFNGELLPKSPDGSQYRFEEITEKTIPEDYRNTKIHRVWKIER